MSKAAEISDLGDPGLSVVIVGAGRHGKEVAAYISDLDRGTPAVELLGFIDERASRGPFANSRILGGFDAVNDLRTGRQIHYITATGDNATRRRLSDLSERFEMTPWTIVHPFAQVGSSVALGAGSCVAPGAIVTTDVTIGRHCILNVKASVSHDCVVGNYSNLNPGATVCGDVQLGEGCYVGAGAVIRDKTSIGPWTIIGAGAVVVTDIPAHSVAVGVPARVVATNPPPG